MLARVRHPWQEASDLVGGNEGRGLSLDLFLFLTLTLTRATITTLATTAAAATPAASARFSTPRLGVGPRATGLGRGLRRSVVRPIVGPVEPIVTTPQGLTFALASSGLATFDRLGVSGRVAAPPAPAAAGGTGHIGLTHTWGRAVVVGDFLGFLVGIVLVVRLEEVGGVQERALLEADVDEGSLDAGKDRFYTTEIDVPHHPSMVGAIDQQLNEPVVLQNGHPRLARGAVDQDLAFHADRLRDRRAARARPPKR